MMLSSATRRGLVALLLLLSTGVAWSANVTDIMAPLLGARERGAFGTVDGRAYAEAQRGGTESTTPYTSVSVLLLPRSAEFDAELDGIKARYRESPDAFLEAEPKLSAVRQAFERALIDAGAGYLLLGESSDARGAFRFSNVPEGAWTLLAWRETPHARRPTTLKTREAARYKDRAQVFGYTTVVFWRVPVQVKAGEEVAVRLHDRNEWLTGTREDRRAPDPNQPGAPKSQPAPAPAPPPR